MNVRARSLAAGLGLAVLAVLTPATPSAAGRPGSYCTAVDTPDEAFVEALYRPLERCPDQAELDYWVGRLTSGPSRLTVVETFERSAEPLGALVDGLFARKLERPPTTEERARWTADLKVRRDDLVLLSTVMSSDAFYAGGKGEGTADRDEAWVELVYDRFLGRDPDQAGLDHFVGTFGPGGSTVASRTRVVRTIAHSEEGRRHRVLDAYAGILVREPSTGERDYWVGWLKGVGRDRTLLLESSFRASSEGYARTQPPAGW